MSTCYFLGEDANGDYRCKALCIDECPANCKFRKTKNEFFEGVENARNRLTEKGLKPVTVFKGSRQIMTTERTD